MFPALRVPKIEKPKRFCNKCHEMQFPYNESKSHCQRDIRDALDTGHMNHKTARRGFKLVSMMAK